MEQQGLVLVACLFFTLVFLLLRALKKSSQKLPPGPPTLPIIGNLHQMIGDAPHRRMGDLAKKYGPIMKLQLGEVTSVVICSPEIFETLTKTYDIVFANRPFVYAADILLYGSSDVAFAPYGEYWRQVRKIFITEMLSAKRVKSFKSMREEEVSKLVKAIDSSEGSPVNLSSMLCSLSFTLTARSVFSSLGKNELALKPMLHQIMKALAEFSLGDLFPSAKFLHVITGSKLKLMKLRRQESKGKGGNGSSKDFLDCLLNLQDHGDLQVPLTTDNVKALILDMFDGSTETSATATEWAMSELIKNPRVMKKAQAEVRQVFKDKRYIDETDIPMLNYLKLVIKETLRLHPPGTLLGPRLNSESANINGYEIPKNSFVIINAWAIGRHPDHWVEPEKFNPERFLNGSIDYKGTDFQLIPFGAGRRICPGVLMGITFVELVLANLLFFFDWKLGDGENPEALDMSEVFGQATKRLNDLCLVPLPYRPLPLDQNN
ncbi:hypothetical protein K2173_010782 [Erythroxylum novogranatense]|uniref:Cytochrome P450 n=1 Tax=Erythroxylum novogranatense TaxID=1862640 RepID=A0AAV8SQZ2_9ROSI|nr:hypothetical protein K2173_010782 [Erythroxylum novogranatense]